MNDGRMNKRDLSMVILPPTVCPDCGEFFNAATGLNEAKKPWPGCPALCINCGAINVFDEDLTLRKITPADEARFAADAETWNLVIGARREILQRGRIRRTGLERSS